MPTLSEQLVVVLHQVRSPDNLGAVARVMANFGFRALRLSDPVTYAFDSARKMAIRGDAVLEGMQVARSLPEALEDTVYVCGTTSRTLEGRPPLSPEVAAERLRAHAPRGRVALVLGGEKRGLSDSELAACQDYLVIPTNAEQPSMNLAQAAAVLLYLCARQEPGAEPQPPGARHQTMEALRSHMERALSASGFLNPQAPEHALGELWRALGRAGLSQREAEMWLAAFKHLARAHAGE
ncbi:MAG TPA: TrmH family RNA methyltransferase [Myxococcaceae bacterium]|nr:TrmH family RNA methyltransferase [Myxococcaceae bacterium]